MSEKVNFDLTCIEMRQYDGSDKVLLRVNIRHMTTIERWKEVFCSKGRTHCYFGGLHVPPNFKPDYSEEDKP